MHYRGNSSVTLLQAVSYSHHVAFQLPALAFLRHCGCIGLLWSQYTDIQSELHLVSTVRLICKEIRETLTLEERTKTMCPRVASAPSRSHHRSNEPCHLAAAAQTSGSDQVRDRRIRRRGKQRSTKHACARRLGRPSGFFDRPRHSQTSVGIFPLRL